MFPEFDLFVGTFISQLFWLLLQTEENSFLQHQSDLLTLVIRRRGRETFLVEPYENFGEAKLC